MAQAAAVAVAAVAVAAVAVVAVAAVAVAVAAVATTERLSSAIGPSSHALSITYRCVRTSDVITVPCDGGGR